MKGYTSLFYDINFKADYFRQFNGSRWFSKTDANNLISIIKKKLENPKFMIEAGSVMEKLCRSAMKKVDEYKNKDWLKASNEEIIRTHDIFHDMEAKIWALGFYVFHIYIDHEYAEGFKNQLKRKLGPDFDKVWEFVTLPEKLTFVGKDNLALLKLAKKYHKAGRVPKKEIEKHLKKFVFIKKYYYWGDGYSYSDLEKILGDYISKGINFIDNEINKISHKKMDLNKYNLGGDEKNIIKGLRKLSYSLNFADEAINYYAHYMRPMLDETAKRLGISYGLLVSMRFEEIKDCLLGKSGINKDVLEERYNEHAIIFAKDKIYVLSGKDLEAYKRQELQEIDFLKINELKGIVGFKKGAIRGPVRVINSDKEIPSFKQGEILVTPMTNPTFIPAIKKALAIITDDGGVLCHAAIISRELGVPCIIGTKIATKVLKDGDFVEVDADKGIVRKLKTKD